jgi:hypothetical protein
MLNAEGQSLASAHFCTSSCQSEAGCCPRAREHNIKILASSLTSIEPRCECIPFVRGQSDLETWFGINLEESFAVKKGSSFHFLETPKGGQNNWTQDLR